jgi:hypothetical protein
MMNGKRKISAGSALRIKKAFPQVAMSYLVTGSGPMFEDGADKNAHDCGKYKIRIRELEEENMRLKARLFDLEEMMRRD